VRELLLLLGGDRIIVDKELGVALDEERVDLLAGVVERSQVLPIVLPWGVSRRSLARRLHRL
jgi:hypothetical protein